jgi:nucleotide-binding universal stress UspA family protein
VAAAFRETMERTVLIGVDDSHHSEVAFDYYARHLHRARNRVVLIHVVPPFIANTNQMILPKCNDREVAMAEEKRKIKYIEETYKEKMKKNAILGRLSIICYCKKPGKIICETASDVRCSFVVLGGGDTDVIRLEKRASGLSSVCDYVLKHCKCPVVIVQSRPKLNVPPPTEKMTVRRGRFKVQALPTSSKSSDCQLQRSVSLPPSSVHPPSVGVHRPSSTSRHNDIDNNSNNNSEYLSTLSLTSTTRQLQQQVLSRQISQPCLHTLSSHRGTSGSSAEALFRLAAFSAGRRLSVKVEEDETGLTAEHTEATLAVTAEEEAEAKFRLSVKDEEYPKGLATHHIVTDNVGASAADDVASAESVAATDNDVTGVNAIAADSTDTAEVVRVVDEEVQRGLAIKHLVTAEVAATTVAADDDVSSAEIIDTTPNDVTEVKNVDVVSTEFTAVAAAVVLDVEAAASSISRAPTEIHAEISVAVVASNVGDTSPADETVVEKSSENDFSSIVGKSRDPMFV